MEKKLYYVVNDRGDVVGHDMDLLTAQECLAEAEKEYPWEGWEILADDGEEYNL